MATTITAQVWLENEVRGIPCGRRFVEVQVGRKWTKLRQPGKRNWHRIPTAIWNTLKGADA